MGSNKKAEQFILITAQEKSVHWRKELYVIFELLCLKPKRTNLWSVWIDVHLTVFNQSIFDIRASGSQTQSAHYEKGGSFTHTC